MKGGDWVMVSKNLGEMELSLVNPAEDEKQWMQLKPEFPRADLEFKEIRKSAEKDMEEGGCKYHLLFFWARNLTHGWVGIKKNKMCITCKSIVFSTVMM